MRSIKDDLEALPDGAMPDAWPFHTPQMAPVNYHSLSLPPLHKQTLIAQTDPNNPEGNRWTKEPLVTIENNGAGNPYGQSAGVGKGYPTRLPHSLISPTLGWTGWCHNTATPRGTYRWYLGQLQMAQFGFSNASDISLNVTGLCCDTPEGDGAGIYIERGGFAEWYWGVTYYFWPYRPYPNVGLPSCSPPVVRIQNSAGVVIASIPWTGASHGHGYYGGTWFEAVITDTTVTLRSWQLGYNNQGSWYWQEGVPLVWEGDVPRGDWTNCFLFSHHNYYNPERSKSGTLIWLDIIPYATPGWMIGQIGWAGNGDEGVTEPPP